MVKVRAKMTIGIGKVDMLMVSSVEVGRGSLSGGCTSGEASAGLLLLLCL